MQIEKPEIMSPLTNEEDSREETQKDNKNDEDIDELLKNIDTKLPDKNVTFLFFYRNHYFFRFYMVKTLKWISKIKMTTLT